MSGTITKHVVVIGELSNQIGKQQLLELSELEQEISCRTDHSAQLQRVKKLVGDDRTSLKNALRLILLYALRYERHANCDTVGLLNTLKQRGGDVHVVPRMLEYAGQNARQGDLFNNVKIMDAVKLTRSLIKVRPENAAFLCISESHLFSHFYTGSEGSRKCVYTTFVFIKGDFGRCFQRSSTRSNVSMHRHRAVIQKTPAASDCVHGGWNHI